jgi:hypothetical protein
MAVIVYLESCECQHHRPVSSPSFPLANLANFSCCCSSPQSSSLSWTDELEPFVDGEKAFDVNEDLTLQVRHFEQCVLLLCESSDVEVTHLSILPVESDPRSETIHRASLWLLCSLSRMCTDDACPGAKISLWARGRGTVLAFLL